MTEETILTKPADIDPFQEYNVHSLNAEYSGTSAGFTFRDGLAIVRALPADADEDDIKERTEAITWLLNAGIATKRVTEDDEYGRPYTRTITGPAYKVAVSTGPVTTVIKKKQPVAAG